MRQVLKVEGLAAARGYRVLFEAMSFCAHAGEMIELRGANGTGKSTLLRILAGLTRPLAGRLDWGEAGREEPLRHFLGHTDAVKPAESAREQAEFWTRFFARPKGAGEAALAQVGLGDRLDIPGRGLSAGQKRRLALSRLLIDPRPVWLLDEPTASLDSEGRDLVAGLVRDHTAAGGLIIAAMHGEGFPGSRRILLDGAET